MAVSARDRGGYTLLEIMLAVAILGLVTALTPRLLTTTQQFFSQVFARADVQRDLRVSVDQMKHAIRQASAASISVAQDSGELPLSKITFSMPDGTPVTFELKSRRLLRTVGARTAVLARNVEFLAFTFPQTDDNTVLSIAMTVKKKTYTGSTALHASVANVRVMNP